MPEPTLREQYAAALTTAAHQCDGNCGLTEQACYDAHPITWSAMAGGTTHVDASVPAIIDTILAVRDHEMATLRDALAAVTGQCRGLEAELAAVRSTIERVRDLAGRYQMWHEGGWAPSSATDVACEYRAVVDGQPDETGNTPPTVRS